MTRRLSKVRQPVESAKAPAWSRRIIVGFVAFHVVAIALFAFPVDIAPARIARDLIAPYTRSIGMSEVWDTFAPNPKSAEQFVRAIVVTRSGQYKLYSFPRMEELTFGQRYQKERYRKFAESILCKECAGLWPDIGRAVARREWDPADPPERVILVKYESQIDPKTGATGEDAAAKSTVVGEMTIRPEDFK